MTRPLAQMGRNELEAEVAELRGRLRDRDSALESAGRELDRLGTMTCTLAARLAEVEGAARDTATVFADWASYRPSRDVGERLTASLDRLTLALGLPPVQRSCPDHDLANCWECPPLSARPAPGEEG